MQVVLFIVAAVFVTKLSCSLLVHMEKNKDELCQPSNEFKSPVIQLQGMVSSRCQKEVHNDLALKSNFLLINSTLAYRVVLALETGVH